MKKLILLIPFIMLLTGCINYIELNNLEVVNTIGIDYKDNNYQVVINTKEKNDTLEYQTYKANAKTIEGAILNLKTITNKKIYTTHLDTLIITKDALDNKLEEIINYFLNQKDSRNDFYLATCNDLELMEDLSEDISKKILIIEQDTASTKSIKFEDFLNNLLSDKTNYLTNLEYDDNSIIVKGITLINDNKIYDTLTNEETIIFNYIYNNITSTTLNKNIVLSSITNIISNKNNIEINIESTIYNKNKSYNEYLKDSISALYMKYKVKDFDIFNLKNTVRKHNYDYYDKNKDNLLDDLKIKVTIKSIVNNKNMEVNLDEE